MEQRYRAVQDVRHHLPCLRRRSTPHRGPPNHRQGHHPPQGPQARTTTNCARMRPWRNNPPSLTRGGTYAETTPSNDNNAKPCTPNFLSRWPPATRCTASPPGSLPGPRCRTTSSFNFPNAGHSSTSPGKAPRRHRPGQGPSSTAPSTLSCRPSKRQTEHQETRSSSRTCHPRPETDLSRRS